jgi:hypothetical protein
MRLRFMNESKEHKLLIGLIPNSAPSDPEAVLFVP